VEILIIQEEEFKTELREIKSCIIIPPPIDSTVPWGFFYGDSQGHPPYCKVGVILFISHIHYIHIRYAPGGGTRKKDKLISLCTLLETTKEKSMSKLQVFQ
jgi:hypothetical protein